MPPVRVSIGTSHFNFDRPAPVQAEQPTFMGDFYEGFVKGGFSKRESLSVTLGQIAGGVVPYYGQAADVRDTSAALKKVYYGEEGGWKELGLSIIGWVPLAGDYIKASKGLTKSTKAVTELESRALKGDVSEVFAKNHDAVHDMFSPKMAFLKNIRSELRLAAYNNSDFIRYMEETVAEGCAQVAEKGYKALPDSLQFAFKDDLVRLDKVISEGVIGTTTVGDVVYGVYRSDLPEGYDARE